MDLLSDHWAKNKDAKKQEVWSTGNIYTNHWAAPTFMVSVEDHGLQDAGFHLKSAIWDAAKTTIEQWTGMELKPTSMYGTYRNMSKRIPIKQIMRFYFFL